jgi:hypothetical protein
VNESVAAVDLSTASNREAYLARFFTPSTRAAAEGSKAYSAFINIFQYLGSNRCQGIATPQLNALMADIVLPMNFLDADAKDSLKSVESLRNMGAGASAKPIIDGFASSASKAIQFVYVHRMALAEKAIESGCYDVASDTYFKLLEFYTVALPVSSIAQSLRDKIEVLGYKRRAAN